MVSDYLEAVVGNGWHPINFEWNYQVKVPKALTGVLVKA